MPPKAKFTREEIVVGVPEYAFDFPVMVLSLAAFAVAYGGLLFAYARRIRRTSLKSVMQET